MKDQVKQSQDGNVERVVVETADRVNVVLDHYRTGHDRVVVIAHGFFNSRKAHLLRELGQDLQGQYDVIIMDFRGHGETSGLFYWTAQEHLDLQAVLEYARREYRRIGLIGFSLGAASSLIAAVRSPIMDSVVSVSSPVAFNKIEYHFWELDLENDVLYNLIGPGKVGKGVRPGPLWYKKDKPLEIVSRIRKPVFYIHGSNDWLIKPWHSEKLYEETESVKRLAIIPGGPHAEYLIRKNKSQTVSLIREWFSETLV